MPEYPGDNSTLDALQTYPSGSVYTLAPKPQVVRGFLLHNRKAVRDLEWDKDHTGLTLTVVDDRPYHVTFSSKGNALRVTCNCGVFSSLTNCEHVVCALMGVKNLLNPLLFKLDIEDKRRREALRKALLSTGSLADRVKRPHDLPSPSEDKYVIVIEKKWGKLLLYVTRNGKRIDSGLPVYHIPSEFLPFTRSYYMASLRQKQLSDYLLTHGNLYPILFKNGKQEIFVRWDESERPVTKTELNVSNGEVEITKRLHFGSEPNECVLAGDFAFNLTGHAFCLIKERNGWDLWTRIRDLCRDERYGIGRPKTSGDQTSFSLPLKDFKKISISIPHDLKKSFPESTLLRVNGQDAYEEPGSLPHYVLKITKLEQDERSYLLEPECRMDSLIKHPSTAPFDFFSTLEMGRIYAPLRARKRKEILHQVFFQALSLETEKAMEETIRSSLTPETFKDYRSMRDARRIVREPLGRSHKEGVQLFFERDRWTTFPLNRRMEGLLYAIPFEIFGPRIFEEGLRMGHRMVVRQEEFSKCLSPLYKRLTGEGIELLFDDQPLRIAKWDFELDATRSTIDWFEIRPEIRCDGVLIDEALWERALSQRGIIERDGVVEILDEESLKKLEALYERAAIRKGAPKKIVRVPRLHILDWILLRKNGIEVKLAPEDERVLERLHHLEKIEDRSIPRGLKAGLRGYQKDGYTWLSFLYENRFGACLADDMGLGKTLQALSLLAGIKEGTTESPIKFVHTHLVVVPPSLLFNWEREIEKFYPDFKVCVYQGKERTLDFRGFDIILTTYGVVRRDIDRLRGIYFDVVIFDEAQTIKNIYADTTGAARQLNASFKLALTGTPIENHIGEYYSIMDLALPGLLGEYDLFRGQAKKEASSFLDILIARTRPFVLRRTKEETLRELPPKIETDFYLDLTEKQKGLYNKTVEAVKSTINEAYRTKTASQARIIALTAILKLRQICLSPQLLIPETKEVSPKIDFLRARLMKLYDEGHHALVFSQFTSFLDIVEKEIQGPGLSLMRLDGSTPVTMRKRLVEGFQRSEHPTVFLLSLKAGGQGLNLTKATYVFHLDPWWNPAVESQASDRAHRIGQKNTVIITRILMKHTIEEKMMELKKRKLRLYKAILESPSRAGRLPITREDFDFLLSDRV